MFFFSSDSFSNDGYRRPYENDRPSFRNRNEYVRQDNRNDYARQDGRNQAFSRFNRNDNPRRTDQTTGENSNQRERTTRQ